MVLSDSLLMENRHVSPFYSLRLSDHFNRPGIIEKANNLDDLTRGLATQPQREADVYFDEEVHLTNRPSVDYFINYVHTQFTLVYLSKI